MTTFNYGGPVTREGAQAEDAATEAERKARAELRNEIGATLKALLEKDGRVTVVSEAVKVGPLGGTSVNILAAVDSGDAIDGVIVNVYCDDRTRDVLNDELMMRAKRREVNRTLREALDEIK